jgi:glycosyltransferase involved in cell wall biosynthesis
LNYCTVAYSTYFTDYRVRRYAESIREHTDRRDAFVISDGKPAGSKSFNYVNVYSLGNRISGEKSFFKYLFNIANFFFRAFYSVTINHFKHHYDVIHVHNLPDLLIFTTCIAKLFGAKIILDIHDVMPELYNERFPKVRPLIPFVKFTEKISQRFADFVIVANHLWLERLVKRNRLDPERATALLNYPNLSFYKTSQSKHQNSVLNLVYPGHLSYHHGIDIAIKGFAIIAKEIPEAKFNIYARTFVQHYREELITLIKELFLQDSVILHGALLPEQLNCVYENSTIGIVPKRAGQFTSEAFSSKIFDFFAAGVPVVLSKTTVDEYYFDQNCVSFFEPGNYNDLADKVIQLYRNKEEMSRLIANGKKYVQENSWDVKRTDYYSIINFLNGKTTIDVGIDAI